MAKDWFNGVREVQVSKVVVLPGREAGKTRAHKRVLHAAA